MGCHTNFYIPANLAYTQAKELAVSYLNQQLNVWTIQNILHTAIKRSNKVNPYNWTEEVVIKQRAYFARWLNRIESNKPIWKAAIYKFQPKGYLFDKLYYKCKEPYFDDCFRVSQGLADRQLTNLQETIDFCTTHKDKIIFTRNSWLEEITEFWQLYPEGIIDLG